MRSSFMRWCVILAFLASLGGHFHAMQCVAWISMIEQRTPREGLPEAILNTISGKDPCQVCLAIRKAGGQEKRGQQAPERRKTVPLYIACSVLLFVPAPRGSHSRQDAEALRKMASAHGSVPSPPPRLS